jgi:hypothetical protein
VRGDALLFAGGIGIFYQQKVIRVLILPQFQNRREAVFVYDSV